MGSNRKVTGGRREGREPNIQQELQGEDSSNNQIRKTRLKRVSGSRLEASASNEFVS